MSLSEGRLAIVLHSHMPYVAGFGTWPFGEEWLWEAIATSYLPLLDVLDSRPGRVTLSLTPVLCDQLEAPGASKSGNPWHVREYRASEYRALCARHFGSVDLLGVFHARKLQAHQWAIEHAGWDAVHLRLRLTRPFYDRFTPAISTRDFALRRRRLDRALDFLAVLRA